MCPGLDLSKLFFMLAGLHRSPVPPLDTNTYKGKGRKVGRDRHTSRYGRQPVSTQSIFPGYKLASRLELEQLPSLRHVLRVLYGTQDLVA